ncbi:MAG: Transposase DDE domain protein [Verrucomicrobia bacterium ADurb.Bin118]|nr:MAG: Transposase DDE domain protein [Verrucomicrobia bacterium ADurb.Bin118]
MPAMNLYTTDPLFAWNRLDDSPDLRCIETFFRLLPDARLLDALQHNRGKGRNEYPVRVLWYCAVLQPLLRHTTMEQTLAELRRNADLRRLGGMEHAEAVPRSWNMSRFLTALGQTPFDSLLRDVFNRMVQRLGGAVSTLGQETAGDATHLSARRARGKINAQGIQPDGGRKEYTGEDGKVERVLEWFGYKLHLLCDTRHEVVLSYTVTPASRTDNEALPEVVRIAKANLPNPRIDTLAYDKACDDEAIHRLLAQEGIRPLIQTRTMWKEEPERPLEKAGIGNVVYDEAGTIYCYDMVSDPPVRHRMAYIGHEPARRTLKYRCPAEHESWRCACSARCNAGKRYGMTVRVKQELDLRRFPPIPRATKLFERRYKGRSACERVNARLKLYWGADDGNLAGGYNFMARIGLVLVVHIGLASVLAKTQRRDPGKLGLTRLSPIARALATG